jgi:hypothetical protein
MSDPDASRFLGTWKLLSAVREEIPSGAKTDLFGPEPVGFLTYSPEGRMMTLIVRSDRRRPARFPVSSEESENLFRGLMSYAGTFEISGGEVIHYVDVSANELWTGTEQKRLYRFEDNRLSLFTPESPDPIDGKNSVRRMLWERVQ